MIEFARALDNPIFMRAVFGRLRFPGAWMGIIVIIVLNLFALGCAFAASTLGTGSRIALQDAMSIAFGAIFILQTLILFAMGSASIASGIAAERDAGVFDMMRMTPQKPLQLVAGYILGLPVREHLLNAICLPFAGIAMLLSRVSPIDGLGLYLVMYAVGLFYHALAALIGMVVKQPRTASGLIVGMVGMLNMILWIFLPFLTVHKAATLAFSPSAVGEMSFFTLVIPSTLFQLVLLTLLIFILALAAIRKFRQEDRPFLSKRQALVMYFLFQVILVGIYYGDMTATSRVRGSVMAAMGVSEYAYCFASFGLALILTAIGTPAASIYARSARRAIKQRRTLIGMFQEGSVNTVFVGLLCIPFLLTAPLLPAGPGRIVVPVVSVTSLIVFGGLLQWIKLAVPKRWGPVLILGLFVIWVVPILLAILCSIMGMGHDIILVAGGQFPFLALVMGLASPSVTPIIFVGLINIILAIVVITIGLGTRERYWKITGADVFPKRA